MVEKEIQELEMQQYEIYKKLVKLRKDSTAKEVENYSFKTLEGNSNLLDLFGDKSTLFMIHNMGQGCRYCTLWADGINAFLPHLEDRFAVALVSRDDPEIQRRMANNRGWRFRMVSSMNNRYELEQSVAKGNMPGLVVYEKQGKKVFRKNSTVFGPGDAFCSIWPILSMAGFDDENWTPQFRYWNRPEKLDDGGNNLKD